MTNENKSPWKIMIEENEKQKKETNDLLRKLSEGVPSPFGPLIEPKPEEFRDYDPNMPEEDVYRELAKLNFRAVVFPFSALNLNYLKSVLPLYDKLLPLIKDEGVRNVAKKFKENVQLRLTKLEGMVRNKTLIVPSDA